MWKLTALVIPLLVAAPPAIVPATSYAADDIKKIVADLDTQYQLAVKNHDVAAMDRILADDFALVTGRGKSFTKADLLKEAHGLRASGGYRADGSRLGRYGRRHRALVGQGHRGWQTIRLQTLVQRCVCAHTGWLALRVRSGFAAAAKGALSGQYLDIRDRHVSAIAPDRFFRVLFVRGKAGSPGSLPPRRCPVQALQT